MNNIKFNNVVIKVIGVGGGGGNAINYMVNNKVEGIDFIAINTDLQALSKISIKNKVQIGKNITKGFGAGAIPEIGKLSAEKDKDVLKSYLENTDMLFITSGMGGGTGTGASPIIAKIAKDLNILTVAIVTKPFSFEGKKRMEFAEIGIRELFKFVDVLIVIPNNKLLKVFNKSISLLDSFNSVNKVLKNAVKGISELVTKPSLINVDFADIKTIMSKMGYSVIGLGKSKGENRALKSVKNAIYSPLLNDIDLSTAKSILVNITSGLNFKLKEFEIIGDIIKSICYENTTIVIGVSLDSSIKDELFVTLIATGICKNKKYNFLKKNNKDDDFFFVKKKNIDGKICSFEKKIHKNIFINKKKFI